MHVAVYKVRATSGRLLIICLPILMYFIIIFILNVHYLAFIRLR